MQLHFVICYNYHVIEKTTDYFGKNSIDLSQYSNFLTSVKTDNVEIEFFDGLLVNFVRKKKAKVIVKGLRAISDFEYELQMALMNRSLKPTCETIFMMPTVNNCFVASSQIKEVAKLGGDYRAYVPVNVYEAIEKKLRGEGE